MNKQSINHLINVFKTLNLIYNVNKKLIITIFILTILTGLSPAVSVILSQELLNSIQIRNEGINVTIKIFIIYIIFSILSDIFSSIKSYVSSKLQILLNYKLNYMLVSKCSKLAVEDFENTETYDQISRLENDISTKPYQTFESTLTFISSFITFISVASILFVWKSWVIGAVVVVPVISSIYYLKIGKQEFLMRYNRSSKERESWYIEYLMTHDFAFKEIKANNLKNYFIDKYWSINKAFIKQENDINKKRAYISILFNITQEIVSACIILLAVTEAVKGKLLIGNVTSYIRSVGTIQSCTMGMITSIYTIYNSNMYMDLMEKFLALKEEDNEGIIIDSIESISFRSVSYKYEDELVLKNVSFDIKKGESIAVIGKNGSGKSTLSKLITGIYAKYTGEIYINNINFKKINKIQYRNHLSVLFQDFLKLEMSAFDNVSLGDKYNQHNIKKVNNVLSNLGVDFLKGENKEYDLNKQLGNWFENGQELSGGQWQKIALARTHYKNSDVYIFDEPSSALDASSANNVFEEFYNVSKNKLGIFITHKISAVKDFNKIIVLDKGKIVGMEKHSVLMENCCLYKELYLEETKFERV
ncbi:ATP-binding cassette domain-containing protein [Macrococcus epidermidis]|uniref:ATP-binding cassette domain-containing protein n=1 Tax=Macrococcus epidermidis TaxID=1902580 RepID=UPI0020B65D91|nr:ABC transporter ATP-binding protein [Macrococcus epidermidis]UTH16273.1 ABC transporter ATP-binding protein [Macrococcus epidermidis]